MRPSFIRSFGRDLTATLIVAALLLSKWAGAAELRADSATQTDNRTGKTVKCQIVYINGDAVIRCPKSAVAKETK